MHGGATCPRSEEVGERPNGLANSESSSKRIGFTMQSWDGYSCPRTKSADYGFGIGSWVGSGPRGMYGHTFGEMRFPDGFISSAVIRAELLFTTTERPII